MTSTFKAGLLATTMAAVALVPAAAVFTFASIDAAFAKGEGNGNGNGNGGNGGGGDRGGDRGNGNGGQGSEARGGQKEAHGGGRPDGAGSRSNGGGRSESARDDGDPISNFIRNISGEERRESRAQARAEARAAREAPTEYAPQASISPGKRPARNSEMHPNQLGNMNGALNANINAVLAHIRNGNVNGPVGGLAALAVADAALAETNSVVEQDRVAALLQENGYQSIQDYYDARVAEPRAEELPELEEAIAALGEDANVEDPWETWRPEPDAVIEAEAALPELTEAQLAAEAGILSLWNKNGDANPEEITPEEEALLDDLRGRLVGYETDIDRAMADAETRAASDVPEEDDEASCEGVEACVDPEAGEEDLAAAD